LDGTTKDSMYRGKLFRKASIHTAINDYPIIVFRLLKNDYKVSIQRAADGISCVLLYDLKRHDDVRLRLEDFEKVKNVVEKYGDINKFPTFSDSDIMNGIVALIAIEFSDRSYV
jgi:hypothetical protein